MKKITLLTALVFSLTMMFSSPSFAEWKKALTSSDGSIFYVNTEAFRKIDGEIYYWTLIDLAQKKYKSTSKETLSYKIYTRGDCNLIRRKIITVIAYSNPMGEGSITAQKEFDNPKWQHLPPSSNDYGIIEGLCALKEFPKE
mgnify:CR=1 FL=1